LHSVYNHGNQKNQRNQRFKIPNKRRASKNEKHPKIQNAYGNDSNSPDAVSVCVERNSFISKYVILEKANILLDIERGECAKKS